MNIDRLLDHPLSISRIKYKGYTIRWTGFIKKENVSASGRPRLRKTGWLTASIENDQYRHEDEGYYCSASVPIRATKSDMEAHLQLGVAKIKELIDRGE